MHLSVKRLSMTAISLCDSAGATSVLTKTTNRFQFVGYLTTQDKGKPRQSSFIAKFSVVWLPNDGLDHRLWPFTLCTRNLYTLHLVHVLSMNNIWCFKPQLLLKSISSCPVLFHDSARPFLRAKSFFCNGLSGSNEPSWQQFTCNPNTGCLRRLGDKVLQADIIFSSWPASLRTSMQLYFDLITIYSLFLSSGLMCWPSHDQLQVKDVKSVKANRCAELQSTVFDKPDNTPF